VGLACGFLVWPYGVGERVVEGPEQLVLPPVSVSHLFPLFASASSVSPPPCITPSSSSASSSSASSSSASSSSTT
jgi:hypothetical protein